MTTPRGPFARSIPLPRHSRHRRLMLAAALVWAVTGGEVMAGDETPPTTLPSAAGEAGPDAATPAPRPAPDGFVEMTVLLVAPTDRGNVVVLTDPAQSVVVPIFIGDTEALAIALRLDGEGFRRPLTHDLIDAILRELGGRLVEVRIDSLEANTFVASLFIRQGEREILLDSRASDSIALALGSDVPIFVSRRVIDEAGLDPHELGLPGTGAAPSGLPQIPL